MLKLAAWFVVGWVMVGGVVYFIAGEGVEVLYGVGLAAVISFLITAKILSDQWEGLVEEIKKEQVYISNSEDNGYYEDRFYAYVRRTNGKRRKTPLQKGWQVGTRLRKQKGKMEIEVVG